MSEEYKFGESDGTPTPYLNKEITKVKNVEFKIIKIFTIQFELIIFKMFGLQLFRALLKYLIHECKINAKLIILNQLKPYIICSIIYYCKNDEIQDKICAAFTIVSIICKIGSIKLNTTNPTIEAFLKDRINNLYIRRLKQRAAKCSIYTCNFCGNLVNK